MADARHRCDVTGCDGTRLGHELASEFPKETQRFDEAMDRLRGPREDRVMPENLAIKYDARPRHLRPHAMFGDDPSGWCGCADCDPRGDCGCPSCRRVISPDRSPDA